MSTERVYISLDGYDDQVFPSSLDDLNFVYDEFNDIFDPETLEQIGMSINGFIEIDVPITDDGYQWYVALHFGLSQGKMAILFPWSFDLSRRDDSDLDRSIAFYTSGNVGMREGEDLAYRIFLALNP